MNLSDPLTILLVIGALGAAVFFIVFLSRLKTLLKLAKGAGSTPVRIHLSEAPAPVQWKKSAEQEKCREFALKNGFQDLGSYSVDEMPGTVLNGFTKPQEGTNLIFYEHPIAGFWVELATRYADDSGITVSNAPRGGELDARPGRKKISAVGKDLPELYELLLKE